MAEDSRPIHSQASAAPDVATGRSERTRQSDAPSLSRPEAWGGPQFPASRPQAPDPLTPYVHRAVVTDAIAVVLSVVAAYILRWTLPADVPLTEPAYAAMASGLVVSWLAVLLARGAYDTRVIGVGSEEFKRIVSATLILLGVVATWSYLLKQELSRVFILVALPTGLLLLLFGRWLLRAWLRRSRRAGHSLHRTLVVGSGLPAAELAALLDYDPVAGFAVVDSVEGPGADPDALESWLDEVMDRIHRDAVDTVALAESPTIGTVAVRRLAWRLEGPRIDLLVAPSLGDVAGPRVTIRPSADLPLLHLDEPRLTGPERVLKRVVDLLVAAFLLVLTAPLLLVLAFMVKASGRGPVFYRQERVGQGGRPFTIRKLRTMVDGADSLRDEVIGTPDAGITDRYRTDPRITPVGRFLRRWSLDELPQLVNVVGGSMSMVGPRPMLADELPLLGDADHRRHLTKPGMTGLWQVNGRKESDWEERMRLDLDYIERWSPSLDLVIAMKTLRVVLSGKGAY